MHTHTRSPIHPFIQPWSYCIVHILRQIDNNRSVAWAKHQQTRVELFPMLAAAAATAATKLIRLHTHNRQCHPINNLLFQLSKAANCIFYFTTSLAVPQLAWPPIGLGSIWSRRVIAVRITIPTYGNDTRRRHGESDWMDQRFCVLTTRLDGRDGWIFLIGLIQRIIQMDATIWADSVDDDGGRVERSK